ncbi:hypothetical protein ACQX8E_15245, partial [Staphylococcus aureus]
MGPTERYHTVGLYNRVRSHDRRWHTRHHSKRQRSALRSTNHLYTRMDRQHDDRSTTDHIRTAAFALGFRP